MGARLVRQRHEPVFGVHFVTNTPRAPLVSPTKQRPTYNQQLRTVANDR